MNHLPDGPLPLDPTGLVQEGYEVPGAASVLKTEVPVEVVCEVVGVPAGEGGTDWTDHLLAAPVTMMTSHMILQQTHISCGLVA